MESMTKTHEFYIWLDTEILFRHPMKREEFAKTDMNLYVEITRLFSFSFSYVCVQYACVCVDFVCVWPHMCGWVHMNMIVCMQRPAFDVRSHL